MVVGAATITSAVLFALFTRVDWAAVAPLAAGLFAGSLAGPWVARRLPPGRAPLAGRADRPRPGRPPVA